MAALDRALTVAEEFGAPAEIAGVLCSQAVVALEQLRLDDARRLAERSLALSALPHPMRLVGPDWVRGMVALTRGRPRRRGRRLRGDPDLRRARAGPRFIADGTAGLARVDAARGRTRAAVTGQGTALRLWRPDGRPAGHRGVPGGARRRGRAGRADGGRPADRRGVRPACGGRRPAHAAPAGRFDDAVRAAIDAADADAVAEAQADGASLTQARAVEIALDLSEHLVPAPRRHELTGTN